VFCFLNYNRSTILFTAYWLKTSTPF